MMSPEMPGQMGPMLAEHLKEGGSAFVIMPPDFDPLADVLAPWGIPVDSDSMLVHEALPTPARRIERHRGNGANRDQRVFVLNQYGRAAVGQGRCQGFDYLLAYAMPVRATTKVPPETTVTPVLPIPPSPHSWAAKGASEMNRRPECD